MVKCQIIGCEVVTSIHTVSETETCSKIIIWKGKIERWGYCSEDCLDKKDGFLFANMNVLTDEECEEIYNRRIGGSDAMMYNKV